MVKNINLHLLLYLIFIITISASAPEGYQYVYPLPGSRLVPYQSTILIRFERITPCDLSNLNTFIEVKGESSGVYKGNTTIASDGKTVIFRPASGFTPGDKVLVTLSPELVDREMNSIGTVKYSFTIIPLKNCLSGNRISKRISNHRSASVQPLKKPAASQARIGESGVSIPSDFPQVNVTINNGPAPGYIFLNNWEMGGGQTYNMILDNSGDPVWYLRTETWDRRRDFKVQKDETLSMLIRGGYGRPEGDQWNPANWGFIGLDQNYNVIRIYRAVDGFDTDEHELQVRADGSYFLIGRRDLPGIDLSYYGGNPNATVRETAIQGFTAAGEKNFEWRALDHFDYSDQYEELESLDLSYIRFPHMNAIDFDDDGNILLSSRRIGEVTKINRETGAIIWRLCGKNNQFTFINDDLNGFTSQHDIRVLGGNHYTAFDNGDLHSPPVSRAVEYALNTNNMTATLIWQHINEYDENYSWYMGNAQRLANGNTFINWATGELPKATEVTQAGEKVFEMWAGNGFHCYRSFRFPWSGMRLTPYLIVESSTESVTLLFNQFGDPDVSYYKIYAGTSPNPTTLLDTSRATLKAFTNLENHQTYYFRVTSVNGSDVESDFSNEEQAYVNIIPPGDNMVQNGDFSSGLDYWQYGSYEDAEAYWDIVDEELVCWIEQGGANIWLIQLSQPGISLVNGRDYTFEFDARADAFRTIEAKVSQVNDPWINYSRIGLSEIQTYTRHYSYTFTMNDVTDYNSRVEINLGALTPTVYIDNVSVRQIVYNETETRLNSAPHQYKLYGNYPNPFNAETTIRFSLSNESIVKIELYNILGELVTEIANDRYKEGMHQVSFNAGDLSSGIYFYAMEVKDSYTAVFFRGVKKMILIK